MLWPRSSGPNESGRSSDDRRFSHRPLGIGDVDHHLWSELTHHLPAHATGTAAIFGGNSNGSKVMMSLGYGLEDSDALGTACGWIDRIFDIAAREDLAIFGQKSSTHRIVGIRSIGLIPARPEPSPPVSVTREDCIVNSPSPSPQSRTLRMLFSVLPPAPARCDYQSLPALPGAHHPIPTVSPISGTRLQLRIDHTGQRITFLFIWQVDIQIPVEIVDINAAVGHVDSLADLARASAFQSRIHPESRRRFPPEDLRW